MKRHTHRTWCLAACAGLGALLVLGPRAGQAGHRDKDWAAIAGRANEQAAELEAHPCAKMPVQSTEGHERAAANLRLAAFYDFTARSLPEKPASSRADKLYGYIYAALQAYRRSYVCAPGLENRGALRSAIDLIDYAISDLKAHPVEGQEDTLDEYIRTRAELSALLPTRPQLGPSPQAVAGEDEKPDPSCLGRRGCIIDADHPELPDAIGLLALGLFAARRRRPGRPGSPRLA